MDQKPDIPTIQELARQVQNYRLLRRRAQVSKPIDRTSTHLEELRAGKLLDSTVERILGPEKSSLNP